MVIQRRVAQVFLILFVVVLGFGKQKEYEVKAYFLEQFTHFIEWPVDSLEIEQKLTFVIGIYGNDPFQGNLSQIYSETTIHGKKVEVRQIHELFEIAACDLLYISKNSGDKLSDIIAVTETRPILTVGDTPGFAEQGVLINFYMDGNRTRFEINHDVIRKTGLSFDYKLLSLARIICKDNK